MKERRKSSPNDRVKNVGSKRLTAATPTDVLCQQSVVRSSERRTVVFYGDAEQVSAGFALALNVMESHADLLTMSSHELNAAEWIVYDALYAFAREMVKRGKPAGQFAH